MAELMTPVDAVAEHVHDGDTVECPFTGEEPAAVPALNPDVTVVHAQRADRAGNVQLGASSRRHRLAAAVPTTCPQPTNHPRGAGRAEIPHPEGRFMSDVFVLHAVRKPFGRYGGVSAPAFGASGASPSSWKV